MPSKRKLEVVDPSGLTDVDWAAIEQVLRAFETGGADAFWNELENLGDDDVILQITVANEAVYHAREQLHHAERVAALQREILQLLGQN